MLPGGTLEYNPAPLHDPTALLYVRESDLDGNGVLRSDRRIEPLILRARAGEADPGEEVLGDVQDPGLGLLAALAGRTSAALLLGRLAAAGLLLGHAAGSLPEEGLQGGARVRRLDLADLAAPGPEGQAAGVPTTAMSASQYPSWSSSQPSSTSRLQLLSASSQISALSGPMAVFASSQSPPIFTSWGGSATQRQRTESELPAPSPSPST